jgi:hypothetical protein
MNDQNLEQKVKKAKKYLIVEPGRLMHTGAFYDDLYTDNQYHRKCESSLINRSTGGRLGLCFGVSEGYFPEQNSSVGYYAHAYNTYHQRSRKEATAVYKKSYENQIEISDFERGGLEIAKNARQKKWYHYTSDAGGVAADAKYFYDWDAIESIICYSEDDAKAFKTLLNEKKRDKPVYLEEKSKRFIDKFDAKIRMDLIAGKFQDYETAAIMNYDDFKFNSKIPEYRYRLYE